MIKIHSFIVLGICIVLIRYLWKLDFKDRTHPNGLSVEKSKLGSMETKSPKTNLIGEAYGPSFFPAIPRKSDTSLTRLKKIEWLSSSYTKEVQWRRALCFGLFGTILLQFETLHEVKNTVLSVIVISLLIYFSRIYNNYHIESYREAYIKKHVKELRKSFLYINAKQTD